MKVSNGQPGATANLLARYRAGDPKALDQLYARYLDRLLAVTRLRMGPKLRAKMESADIVQEAVLASLRGLGSFEYKGEGAFFHYLCKLAENRMRDMAEHFGALRRDVARERPLEPLRPTANSTYGPILTPATLTSPATRAMRKEELERLEQAVDSLPEPQREALLLVRYVGLAFAEAGDMLGKSPDAVRMLVARAMVALAKKLDISQSSRSRG
jgi:RNA polymerase sigma-70 factor (ECF subfamily)